MARKRRRRNRLAIATPATVRVRGEGVAKAAPDAAKVIVGIVVADSSLQSAREGAAAQAATAIAAAKAAGVPASDLQTSEYRIQPVYRHSQSNDEPPAIAGYEIRNSVAVTVRDLTRLADLLDVVVAAGSNQISGPEFFLQHPDVAEDAARRAAMASARRHAETLASTEGGRLGRVLSIAEGDARHVPTPRVAMRALADAPPTPIEAGTERISATVEVTWELV
mgnify:CR=1 FL=1